VAADSHFPVPDDLAERDQWMLWSYVTMKGKPTKVPYNVAGKAADITDPRSWSTYQEAASALCRNRKRYAGLGFVFCKQDRSPASTLIIHSMNRAMSKHGRGESSGGSSVPPNSTPIPGC
jgi:hypothetical protein